MGDKYVQNLIQAGASPHLIAKLSTLPPTPKPQPVVEPVQDETHGSDDPAPAPRRGRPRKGS